MKVRRITNHPEITPTRLAEMRAVRQKIDRKEKQKVLIKGQNAFARYEKVKQTIAALNDMREKRHLTLEQMAERTGIGKASLSRLFNQQQPNPTIDTLLRISEAVGYELLHPN